MQNTFFQLFGLPETFDIDTEALEAAYRRLAARFHPDKTATASSFEQKQAVMMAATVNQAYLTLKDPLNRAAYLLENKGIAVDAPEHTQYDPSFLMQQMEWREQLADARYGSDAVALQTLSDEIQSHEAALNRKILSALAAGKDNEAAALVRQGRFLDKLQQEIKEAA